MVVGNEHAVSWNIKGVFLVMAMLDAPGDHFMALIKFSLGIERLRHRVVVAFLTIMERIGWRVTTIRRTNRGSTRKNMKRAGGYCITTPLGAF